MEFLCNYYFPHCENDTKIVPICDQSCTEHLRSGICANHVLNVLTVLNTADYPNISVDGLLQYNCSPPYNVAHTDDCNALTGWCTWIHM